MRVWVLSGALLLAAATASAALAEAQPAGGAAAAPGNVPTVTIINKAPPLSATPAGEVLPELKAVPAEESEGLTEVAPAEAADQEPAAEAVPSDAGHAEHADRVTGTDDTLPAPDADAAAAEAQAPDAAAEAAEVKAPEPPPEPTLAIDVDLTRQVLTVSEEGEVRHSWPISSARTGYRTPTGTFQPTWMAKMWYSRQYDYSPMPHAVFFHKGVAIHGSYATRMLGRPASHGCVRLAPKNAATLFRLVGKHGKDRTQIVVHGTPDHSSARVAARERPDRGPRQLRRGSPYAYAPPRYPRGYSAYGPPPGYYYAPRRRAYAPPPRYAPRGLYNSYSYGYGF